jgi:hypothetical protein
VSATECTASASIDDEPVIKNPTNLAAAIPAFATNAAMMALVPPPADTPVSSLDQSGLSGREP